MRPPGTEHTSANTGSEHPGRRPASSVSPTRLRIRATGAQRPLYFNVLKKRGTQMLLPHDKSWQRWGWTQLDAVRGDLRSKRELLRDTHTSRVTVPLCPHIPVPHQHRSTKHRTWRGVATKVRLCI